MKESCPMDTEGDLPFRPRTGKAAATPLLPEVEAYLQLLLMVYLTNNKCYNEERREREQKDLEVWRMMMKMKTVSHNLQQLLPYFF
nr:26S proteasome non-ATPase regulatory subunit 3 isoform X2 [Paramormyrops kingsleyae]